MHLRDAALRLLAQGANQGKHVQPTFPMWQCPGAFFLRAIHLVEARTASVPAPIPLQGQAIDALERRHRAMAMKCHPYPPSTSLAGAVEWLKGLLVSR
jgi:hypothetical protein